MVTETELSPGQHKKLSRIVYEESGVVLNEKKYSLLVARIAKRMRITKITSVNDYINLISSDPGEFSEFIDATTTNHTFFFRENKHCEYLIKILDKKNTLKIWSAASSSGEEAFSIAIQLLANSFSFSIFASDVSDSMLNLGRRAVYPKARVKDVPLSMLHAYFQKGKDKKKGYVKVKPAVQQLVTFAKFNLLSDTPADTFDIIFCRNVMIYFDTPTRQRVVDNLCQALKPGGYFFVGLAESLNGLDHSLTTILPSGYQKK
ncbi:CheR1 [Desulforapulum autotrophicum HRM2]|uniref:protein-glutamate O-methyltransferase n=1 Tax=Desulforapulum autotrophicum (strain ATCC 43914 / DSM 3382 / VKM B-1955 / HRM2) TaxID=177437 RepID=C0Q917_DESAH|nr:CheR family methyltransferase [Desulforapulum autotrophicum]ACN16522.1 CheR1 [Desulforapulum autotrophicum HRM2]